MPINHFAATPATIRFGESTTLRWTTQGADAVYLNWRGVPHQGEEVVTPIVTTDYVLHVAREDGSGESSTLTVVSVTPVSSPPMTPAMATGRWLSAMTRSSVCNA